MAKQEFNVARGHKDWYGVDTILRNEVRDTLRRVFERFGFYQIETPIIEDRDAIAFKGGGEIQKEVYQLSDQGNRSLALRFDHTVPLARFVATHSDIRFPFKRYAMGEVFRDGPTQPEQGRFRSFTQCDVDILGVAEMAAEAELFALAQNAFEELGFGGIEVKINNRKLLDGILDYAGVPDYAKLRTISVLDKLDKQGPEGVRKALGELTLSEKPMTLSNDTFKRFVSLYDGKGPEKALSVLEAEIIAQVSASGFKDISNLVAEKKTDRPELIQLLGGYETLGNPLLTNEVVDTLMAATRMAESNDETCGRLSDIVNTEMGREGLDEIRQVLAYSKSMGYDFIQFDPSLARGLDYYTGTTIEVFLKDRSVMNSAILAGGRFDDMVGDFRGGEEIPAVGFSFGLDRLAIILRESKDKLKKTTTDIYLIPIGTTDQSLKIANQLRAMGLNVDMDFQNQRLGKSIAYADALGIPYVGIVGENELAKGTVSVRNLITGQQDEVKFDQVRAYIKE